MARRVRGCQKEAALSDIFPVRPLKVADYRIPAGSLGAMLSTTQERTHAVPSEEIEAVSPDLSRVRQDWEVLAERVRAFDPTVVVLVARKPARMFQALGIEPAPGALVVSDLAIPYMAETLSGARVAVVDDVVNVGSTLRRVCRLARDAGAGEVQAFAISGVEREIPLEGLDVDYASHIGLDEFDLRQFGRRIPQTLQWHSKPYDLTFPVMERELTAPFVAFDNLLAALRGRYGGQYVYDLSLPGGAGQGMRRCAVDLTDGASLRKVNLYVDEDAHRCTIVPIALTPVLRDDGPALPPTAWAAAVWGALSALPREDDLEARCRLGLFVDGLSLGESFIAEHGGFLRNCSKHPFNLEDAELALGPAIARVRPGGRDHHRATRSERGEDGSVTSPFLEAATRNGLQDAVAASTRSSDPLSIFIAIFEELSRRVGANEPSRYSLDWPYSYEQIQEEPYLRLRIGPTIADLVAIVDSLTGAGDLNLTRRRVTRLLDRHIDSGGVVPTVATYEGNVYRIYRQGEASPREDVSRRVRYAWGCYGKPLSLTRATKVLTILALDSPQGADSQVEIEAAPRGNTLCFQESVLDSRTEITHYLRNTAQLRKASEA